MYRCEVCKQVSQLRQPCLVQHFEDSEEKRCPNCYSLEAEILLNARKSVDALNINLSYLQEMLRNANRNDNSYFVLVNKIRETENRIAGAKTILGSGLNGKQDYTAGK